MAQEEKRDAMERENIEGTASMTGQGGIDDIQDIGAGHSEDIGEGMET